jgi:hypothetical protein
LFRSRKWEGNLSRTFPQLIDLLDEPPVGTYTAEALPGNNRTMVFRATARDGWGRYGFTQTEVSVFAWRKRKNPNKSRLMVVEQVGPFVVTEPSTHELWKRGSSQLVRWDVAKTDLAPIRCKWVKISLLMRGNNNTPFLLAKVLNNGSATVNIPLNAPVGAARVKVEAVGNIFFNVAAADVEITRQ